MEHGPELTIVLVACFVLAIGAGVKLAAKRFKFPYSVAMLVLGLATGGLLLFLRTHELLPHGLHAMASGTPLNTDLILFVFVPTLVFESALSLDTYHFARNIGPIATLAVPAMLACTVATAFLMVGVTGLGWEWSLPIALVFGALISATDPVAVVALLRDVGAPKRLSLLIEGESLLNDATAIVAFTLLIGFAVGGEFSVAASFLGFLKVLAGGVAVGLVMGISLTWLLSRIFDEPKVEITLTIVMGYAAMILAEASLHVSGVIAIVTLGLWMSGPGRPSISPEVRHRQHDFLGMLTHIANTLIFFLAGMVIAGQFEHYSMTGLVITLVAWAGIMAIRFVVVFAFRPLMGLLGPPVSARQSIVMAWGGLRGAVSLALALLLAANAGLAEGVRGEMLRLTAGVVLLTILVNGTTTGWLLRKLGFSKRPPGERLMRLLAQARVLAQVEGDIERLSARSRYRTIHWHQLRESMHERRRTVEGQIRDSRNELRRDNPAELEQLTWYQAIAIERSAYDESNETGMITGPTLQILAFEIDAQLERLAAGDLASPDSRSGRALRLRNFVLRVARRLPFVSGKVAFRDISRLYELAWVESLAASRVLQALEENPDRESEGVRKVSAAYQRFRRTAHQSLEDLRGNAPEVATAIELRLGKRVELNLERTALERFDKEGLIPDAVAADFLKSVEHRMASLALSPVHGELPSTAELLRGIPLFRSLEPELLKKLAEAAREVVFARDEVLLREGEKGDAMFIIARGAAHVVKGQGESECLLDVLGGGEVVGEMALLTGEPRSATVRAATTVTALRLHLGEVRKLVDHSPQLRRQLEDAWARHVFDNLLRGDEAWQHLTHAQRRDWPRDKTQVLLHPGDKLEVGNARWVFLLSGALKLRAGTREAPAMLQGADADGLEAERESRAILLDEPPVHPLSPTAAFLSWGGKDE
ncbi:MAG: cation:proton antiporter [Planctomycetes bacterium]|nr:cation:proton antiporter [Planctomycetota bacterium]